MPMVTIIVMVVCDAVDCKACASGTFDELEVLGWKLVPPITVERRCGIIRRKYYEEDFAQRAFCPKHCVSRNFYVQAAHAINSHLEQVQAALHNEHLSKGD